jgi:replication-associated recombination protein RarA
MSLTLSGDQGQAALLPTGVLHPQDRTASLYGPIGSGKTSLLHLIAQEVYGDPETNAT